MGSIKEAFDRYLGDHARCYVPREKVTPAQAIELIHQGGGKAIFAHPLLCRLSKERLESFLDILKKAGLDGMETVYSTYTPADQIRMTKLAKRYGLKCSGGSDFHGANNLTLTWAADREICKSPTLYWRNCVLKDPKRSS